MGAVCRRMRQGQQRAEIRFDGLAHALRTPGGGSSIQRFLLIDGDGAMRSRKPTPRECARLMGLPEDYVPPRSTTDAYHLTGDAWWRRWWRGSGRICCLASAPKR